MRDDQSLKEVRNMNILVSACLLGVRCRYSGDGCENTAVAALREKHHLIPVCPEQLGGMPTPRAPAELKNGRVRDREGHDFTEQFDCGAREAARLAEFFGCEAAIMKSRSPSCGCGKIYDGAFGGRLVPGNGRTAALLLEKGLKIYTEEDVAALRKNP